VRRTGSAVLADDGGLVGVKPDLALATGHDGRREALLKLQAHHVSSTQGMGKDGQRGTGWGEKRSSGRSFAARQ